VKDYSFIPNHSVASELDRLRAHNPLIHCVTNEVVQEITANVLLAAGASPAMVVGDGETELFASVASGLLINVGTPYAARIEAMKKAVRGAKKGSTPWVLDPVAAGGMPWRNRIINQFVELRPTAIRGNASEILYLSGVGAGGKGVDSTAKSDDAVDAAVSLAQKSGSIVVVTGETDYATDGERILATRGGSPLITKVVGTGCSLSALLAAFLAGSDNLLVSAAACCAYVNRAGETAASRSRGPGSFHNEYLDALYNLKPGDFQ
jgi:hydroxyethylthiazole kinase